MNQLQNTVCNTCAASIYKNKLPLLCLSNGLNFPEQPNCLKILSNLEERLISPRIPFMRIYEVGPDQQKKMKGNIVNVPVDIDKTLHILPRQFNETKIIQLELMRRMQYKRPYMKENIRPKVIIEALSYLITKSLYIKENILINTNWIKQFNKDSVDFHLKYNDHIFTNINDSNSSMNFRLMMMHLVIRVEMKHCFTIIWIIWK